MPFPISYDQLVDENGNQRVNLTIDVNGTDFPLSNTLMSVQNNEISLLVEYNFTIECYATKIDLNLIETIYTPEKSELSFNACGDNKPLVISEYYEMFQKT